MAELYKNTTIVQWNARGLRSKMGDLRELLYTKKFPVLAINEAGVPDTFRISQYVNYISRRPQGMSRAMLCVRQDIPALLMERSETDTCGFVKCKVCFGAVVVTVVCVYLPPATLISENDLREIFARIVPPLWCAATLMPTILCGAARAWMPEAGCWVTYCWKQGCASSMTAPQLSFGTLVAHA